MGKSGLRRIFVDTGYIIALVNKRDQRHQQAVELAARYGDSPLLTTNAVLLEVGNALVRNYKNQAIKIIEQFLDGDNIEVVSLTPQLFNQALRLYKIKQRSPDRLLVCIKHFLDNFWIFSFCQS